jgi:hypothetical protein
MSVSESVMVLALQAFNKLPESLYAASAHRRHIEKASNTGLILNTAG